MIIYPQGLTEFGKRKYLTLEQTLWKFRELGYTADDIVYRALVAERDVLKLMASDTMPMKGVTGSPTNLDHQLLLYRSAS